MESFLFVGDEDVWIFPREYESAVLREKRSKIERFRSDYLLFDKYKRVLLSNARNEI